MSEVDVSTRARLEIDPEMFDDEAFNKGVNFAMDVLAAQLGKPEFYASDGSEDYETDLGDTMLNALAAAGLYDKDEAVFATLAAPALTSIPAHLYWLIGRGRNRPSEPMFGCQLIDPESGIVVAEAEAEVLSDAIKSAISKLPKQT